MHLAPRSLATCFQVCSKYARLEEVHSGASCFLVSLASYSEKTSPKPCTPGHLTQSALSTRGALLYTSEKASKRESLSTFFSIASGRGIEIWALLTWGRMGRGEGTTRSGFASISGRADGRQNHAVSNRHSAILTD